MHPLIKISNILGINIPKNKPKLHLEFFPIKDLKYITIYNDKSIQSNSYDYFNDVVQDIYNELNKNNIKIYQILNSEHDEKIKNCEYIYRFNFSQLNYILKNSLLHICTDLYTNEICGITSTKSISLIGNRFEKESTPYYSDDKNTNFLISKYIYKKPSFSNEENPKSINSISSEEISNKIFEMIGIQKKLNYKTLYIGDSYNKKVCDIIPNYNIENNFNNFSEIFLRLDKIDDKISEKELISNCSNFIFNNTFNISTNKSFSENLLNIFKRNCKKVFFYVNEDTNLEDLITFIKNGFHVNLCFSKKCNKDKTKIKFINFSEIIDYDKKVPSFSIENKNFKTNKLIFYSNTSYKSYHHIKNNLNDEICYDTEDFLEDIDFYKIIEKESCNE